MDLYRLVYSMNENTLSRLEEAVEAVKFDKKILSMGIMWKKRSKEKGHKGA